MTSPVPTTYKPDERVLAYHGPLIYEAKVLKTEDCTDQPNSHTGEKGFHCFIHYKGWKQSWDEWVHWSRLLKHTEANIAIQKQERSAHTAATSTSKTKATGVAKDKKAVNPGTLSRGTKRGRDDDALNSGRPDHMRIDVPELLKAVLVDDWEAITNKTMLVELPRSPTVEGILGEFEEHIKTTKPDTVKDPQSLVGTVVQGLKIYFDKSLGMKLLYRFERAQFAQIRVQYITGHHVEAGSNKEMSEIYGGEHLLRMLVMLPEMIAQSGLDQESVAHIREYVNELLRYMAEHKEKYFLSEYINAPTPYLHQMAKG